MQYINSLDLHIWLSYFSLLISKLWTHHMIIQKYVFDLLFKSHTFCLTSHTQKIFLCNKIMYIVPPKNPIYIRLICIRPHILNQLSIFFLCYRNFSRKTSHLYLTNSVEHFTSSGACVKGLFSSGSLIQHILVEQQLCTALWAGNSGGGGKPWHPNLFHLEIENV